MPGAWTCPADVRAAVRKKWDSGALLKRFAGGHAWEPIGLPIHGPTARQIGERLTEVRQWAGEWSQVVGGPLRIEYKKVGGRHFGANVLPCRAWLDSYADAWALLKVGPDVRRLSELIEASRSNAYDQSVRLEQERIRFSAVKAAVAGQPDCRHGPC